MKRIVINGNTVEYDSITDVVTVDDMYKASVLDMKVGKDYVEDWGDDDGKRESFSDLVFEEVFTIMVRVDVSYGCATVHTENDAYTIFDLNLW